METIGELIEKLVIENIRLWRLQDMVVDSSSLHDVGKTAKQIIEVNRRRSQLRAEVSNRLGENEQSIKIYGGNHVQNISGD